MYTYSNSRLITVRAAKLFHRGIRSSSALYRCYRLHDYEGMLMFDHAHMIAEYCGPVPYQIIALDIAANCPPELMRQNLVKLLRIAYTLHGDNCISAYVELMDKLRALIGTLHSPAMQRQFTGEWLLISAFQNMRCPEKLLKTLTEAATYITKSLVLDNTSPLFMDSTSILGATFSTPGTVDALRRDLALALPIYTSLTGGGHGIMEFFDAEAAYYRYELDTAYTLALKAQSIARLYQQDVLFLSVTKLLAHIYKHRADTAGWARSIAYIERIVQSDPPNGELSRIIATGLINELNCSIANTSALPGWLRNPVYSGFTDLGMPCTSPEGACLHTTSTFLMASWQHSMYLYVSDRFPEAEAAASSYIPFTVRSQVVVMQAYQEVIISMAALRQGDSEGAVRHMNKVFSLVMPDGLIMVFIEFMAHFGENAYELFSIDAKVKAQLKSMSVYYCENVATMYKAISRGNMVPSDLTDRERDVAMLTAQGFTNKEIATQLSVSVNTVKTHLASIFSKLSVNRRTELINALNTKLD